jgi:hypothetical protein
MQFFTFLQYITTLEGGDTLVTKDVDDATAVVTRKFTDDGLLMVRMINAFYKYFSLQVFAF